MKSARGKSVKPAAKSGAKRTVKRTKRAEDALLTVEEAAALIKAGRMIIVVDDEDRENEGDLVFAAERRRPRW